MNLRQQLQLDVALQFGRYCKSELDDAAREKLGKAIDRALVNQLNAGAFSWDDKTRRFVLTRVAEAARKCQKAAGDGKLTAEMMNDIVKVLVPKWERGCIIPDKPKAKKGKEEELQPLGPPCAVAALVFTGV